MPLVRRRDTLSDLIRKGGDHKSILKGERVKQSELMIHNLAILNSDGEVIRSSEEVPFLLRLSAVFLWIVEQSAVKFTRFVAIVLAFTIVIVITSGHESEDLYAAMYILEYICDVYYILDGTSKLFSMYAYVEIVHNHLYQKITRTTYLRRSGVVDLLIAVLSLVYIYDSMTNRWLHLIRCACISLFYLEQLPQIDVLSSGISAGLTSTLYTWLLMTVTFLVYAAAGVIFFKENDPYHFGDISMAMWTYFEMSTLDNWKDVLNINYFGCEEYSADYYVNGTADEIIKTEFGSLYLPICWKPEASPISATLLFVSFVLICAFILVSLTVAFVTTGINTRLHELQKEEDKEELRKEMGIKKKIKIPRRRLKKSDDGKNKEKEEEPQGLRKDESSNVLSSSSSMKDTKTMLMSGHSHGGSSMTLSEVKDPELLRQLLKQVWKGDVDIVKEEVDYISQKRYTLAAKEASFSGRFFGSKPISPINRKATKWDIKILKLGVRVKRVVSDNYYNYFIYAFITFAAILELLSIQDLVQRHAEDIASIICQFIFTVDLTLKLLSNAPRYKIFFQNNWNVFDFVLVLVLWFPVFSTYDSDFFELLKVLRIIRVLKMLSFIEELNVIIKAISTSARCLAYVIWFMLMFFFHFGAAGVFLFSENDPFHFENLGRAMLSLFQVSTLDDWKGVVRMNMYGCKYIENDPEFCDLDKSKGYGWLAAWYFAVFVVVGVMVLVALFIGVIITSMELLHTSIHEEADMLKKVREKQNQLSISDATCTTLLEIFDMIDVCANGRLTLNELKPVLAMVSLAENQQYELFHKIDEDASGKIDFAEFCELIKLMGETYRTENPATPLKDNITKLKILQKLGFKTKGILPIGNAGIKGWGAVTAGVMTAKALSSIPSNEELDQQTSLLSPSAKKPSTKQFTSLTRKSMLLTAARIEIAKMAEQAALDEANGCVAESAILENSLTNNDLTTPISDEKSQECDNPPLSSEITSILKKRGQKASGAVAKLKEAAAVLELSPTLSEPSPDLGVEVAMKKPISEDLKVKMDSPGANRSREDDKQGPHMSAEAEEKKEPAPRDNVVKSPHRTQPNVYDQLNALESMPIQDAITATFLRYPSDDSLVSRKYKAGKGNNAPSIENIKAMRKFRSGPIDTSGAGSRFTRLSDPSDEELSQKQKKPNLFFDYKDGSDDNLDIFDAYVTNERHSPVTKLRTGRPHSSRA